MSVSELRGDVAEVLVIEDAEPDGDEFTFMSPASGIVTTATMAGVAVDLGDPVTVPDLPALLLIGAP